MKKLSPNGFAHQVLILAVVVIAIVGGIGSYVMLRNSRADVCDNTCLASACRARDGVWLDLRPKGISHDPCWANSGAYLVNYGTGKVGDGIDHVPSTGLNAETGSTKSEKFNNPDYVIVAGTSSKWQLCGTSSTGKTTCTSASDPFTHFQSAPYRPLSGGGEAHMKGGGYILSKYDFYWSNSDGRFFTNFSSDKGIWLQRVYPK